MIVGRKIKKEQERYAEYVYGVNPLTKQEKADLFMFIIEKRLKDNR